MGVCANGFRDSLGVVRTYGATASNNAYPSAHHCQTARVGAMRNLTAGEGITSDLVSRPSGNRHPNVWMMPQKVGALAARNTLTGEGEISDADTWAVKLATATINGDGTLTATGGLIVQALAALTGTGEISSANVQAFLAAVASITGTGGISAAAATAFGELLAALTGSGAVSSTATGIGELEAEITVTGTGLSTANVGQAVWSAIATANDTPGTMGEKLNDAGSAGNPWATVIESGFTAEEVLKIIAAAVAGKVSGAEANAPVFKGLDGTTDRITATTDDNGNRLTIALDGS